MSTTKTQASKQKPVIVRLQCGCQSEAYGSWIGVVSFSRLSMVCPIHGHQQVKGQIVSGEKS